jgi:hypothetical protein
MMTRLGWLGLPAIILGATVAGASDVNAQGAGSAVQTAGVYKIPDRVEVDYGGTWYPGNVYAVRDGRYKVMRDKYTSDDRWVTSAELRPLAAAVRKTAAATSLPRDVQTGSYVCTTIAAGFSSGSSTGTTIGTLQVVGSGVYTSLTKEGTGTRSRFSYDPSSGNVTWDGGSLKGFFGKVVESRFGIDNRGVPYFAVVYRVREGGNLFDLSCRREGA